MTLTCPISQDIIDIIIEKIPYDDVDTLKQCSLASQAFLGPGQRQLFSVIYLRSTPITKKASCRRLYRLLTENARIASYIRELHVIVSPSSPFEPQSLHLESGEWVYDEETFPRLLRILQPFLRSFSLVGKDHALKWARFSPELQASLLELCQSPNLTTLRFVYMCAQFPLEMLSKLKQLKRLGFVSCSHWYCSEAFARDGLEDPPPLEQHSLEAEDGQLESIELGGHTSKSVIECLLHPHSLLGIAQLQSISIGHWTWVSLDAVLRGNEHVTRSIESVMWLDSSNLTDPSLPLTLEIFPRLRFLGFCVSAVAGESGQLRSIARMLVHGVIPNTLEELSIIVESKEGSWDLADPASVSDVCALFGQTPLDTVLLLRCPNLRRINVLVDTSNKYPDDEETLGSLLPQELPLLAERGVLFWMLCDKSEVLARISSYLPAH